MGNLVILSCHLFAGRGILAFIKHSFSGYIHTAFFSETQNNRLDAVNLNRIVTSEYTEH